MTQRTGTTDGAPHDDHAGAGDADERAPAGPAFGSGRGVGRLVTMSFVIRGTGSLDAEQVRAWLSPEIAQLPGVRRLVVHILPGGAQMTVTGTVRLGYATVGLAVSEAGFELGPQLD